MLVHKESRGVLYEIWEGLRATQNGTVYFPLRRHITCQGLSLDRQAWWELADNSPLAKRIRRCYPCFDPVLDETGRLVDIVTWTKVPTEETKKQPRRRQLVNMNNGNQWKRGGALV